MSPFVKIFAAINMGTEIKSIRVNVPCRICYHTGKDLNGNKCPYCKDGYREIEVPENERRKIKL
jgi:hypothetical protein